MSEEREFMVEDIKVYLGFGGRQVLVAFPYAQGAPELMKRAGGRWDKLASAWAFTPETIDKARRKFPRLAELVRVQLRIDAEDRLAKGLEPRKLDLGILRVSDSTPLRVVGDDWIAVGELSIPNERDALRALGCAPQLTVWYAPDEEIAQAAQTTLVAVREAAENARLRAQEEAEAQRAREQKKQERLTALADQVTPIFGKRHYQEEELEALAELSPLWPSARFVTATTKTLDGRGTLAVQVTTPSGRELNMIRFIKVTETKVSRRVDLREVEAPCFPEGSAVKVRVTTHRNGKNHSRYLPPYQVEQKVSAKEEGDASSEDQSEVADTDFHPSAAFETKTPGTSKQKLSPRQARLAEMQAALAGLGLGEVRVDDKKMSAWVHDGDRIVGIAPAYDPSARGKMGDSYVRLDGDASVVHGEANRSLTEAVARIAEVLQEQAARDASVGSGRRARILGIPVAWSIDEAAQLAGGLAKLIQGAMRYSHAEQMRMAHADLLERAARGELVNISDKMIWCDGEHIYKRYTATNTVFLAAPLREDARQILMAIVPQPPSAQIENAGSAERAKGATEHTEELEMSVGTSLEPTDVHLATKEIKMTSTQILPAHELVAENPSVTISILTEAQNDEALEILSACRGRGRPLAPGRTVAMTKAERNKKWRKDNRIVAIEVPQALVDRLRHLRKRHGGSTAELLATALDALERLS